MSAPVYVLGGDQTAEEVLEICKEMNARHHAN